MTTEPNETSVPRFIDLLQRYELDQRLNITKRADIILGVSTVLGFGGNIGYVFSRPNPTSLMPLPALISIFASIVVYSFVLLYAYRAANQRQIIRATYITVLGCTLLVVGIQLVWVMVSRNSGDPLGLDDQSWQMFMAYFVPIALAVVIGDNRLLYITVALLNVISTVVLSMAFLSTGQDVSSRHQFIGLWIGAMMTEWSVAIIILAMRSGFRRIIFNATRLQYAVDRARQLDELKDQFISSVNHELRNPVMALRGYLDALETLDLTLPTERRQHFIAQAIRSCGNIQDLIESVLSIRRIDQTLANLKLEDASIPAVLQIASEQIDPREAKAQERPLHIGVPATLTAWADRIRLQQVLTNLLSNAIKYSAPGTPIEVNARRIQAPPRSTSRDRNEAPLPNMVELTVRDYGLGIPPDQIPLLFQKFVRLPRDLGSNIIGNGLGLFACREILEALHGRIWVESTGIPGEGSTFFVLIPATETDATLAAALPSPADDLETIEI